MRQRRIKITRRLTGGLRRVALPALLACVLLSGIASAQMFGASTGFNNNNRPAQTQRTPAQPAPTPRPASSANAPANSARSAARAPSAPPATPSMVNTGQTTAAASRPAAELSEEEPENVPSAFELRFVGGEAVVDDSPKIMLYMRDFKVANNLNGRPSCTMRFYILSSAPEKITNISYRLKWPKMETALSFDDVAPNTPTYFDYALLGNGCYSMDKAPNIIVNRCRIKGMTQRQCADAIQWME